MARRRYRANESLSNQTRLPPIRPCGTAQNRTSQGDNVQDDNFPLSFLRLPPIEKCSIMESKTPLSLQETEEIKSCVLTLDEKITPLCQAAAKHGTCTFERSKDSNEVNTNEKTYIQSGAHRIGGKPRLEAHHLPKNRMTNGKPIADKAVFRRPVQLLRRRLKPCQKYQHSDAQLSHEELLTFEQNMDQMRAFSERDKMIELTDFNGEKIDQNKTGDSDITSYIAMFEVNNSTDDNKCASTKTTFPDEETNVRVRGRFYEALDLHFYHYYRNTHPERRMAICEEIERSIVVDDLALTCFREHLSLQDVMNTWML
ncbi:hypothetical protein OS493_025286 [Desmophyllum pertusum]|uniref:Uncharacterized protein n=1 Tax=Desmophyllum pertusum TaxID=174260 RepID=A0A9X0CWD1_9CNID|nr:hypothetical protein OS493_025286 [Desmophyllum pertusum]